MVQLLSTSGLMLTKSAAKCGDTNVSIVPMVVCRLVVTVDPENPCILVKVSDDKTNNSALRAVLLRIMDLPAPLSKSSSWSLLADNDTGGRQGWGPLA